MFARQQMSQMLGVDEATLARSLAKQKLLSDLGVSDFVNESFEDIRAEVMKSSAYQALSPDEKDKKLKEIFEATDMRTTEEKQLDRLDSIVTDGIRLLSTPEEMRSKVEQRSADALKASDAFNAAGSAEAFTKEKITSAGAVVTTLDTALTAQSMIDAFTQAFQTTEFSNPWTIRASDVTIATDGQEGNDVALPGGSSRAIFGPEGMINLNKKDSIIAGTDLFGQNSGGGSSDVAALAAAIVTAINKQTDELTSNSRMNGSYWS